eukprot:9248730-Prorocentrum_lima.AAC.1
MEAVAEALRSQLLHCRPGSERLPPVRCGALRRARNEALHAAEYPVKKEIATKDTIQLRRQRAWLRRCEQADEIRFNS